MLHKTRIKSYSHRKVSTTSNCLQRHDTRATCSRQRDRRLPVTPFPLFSLFQTPVFIYRVAPYRLFLNFALIASRSLISPPQTSPAASMLSALQNPRHAAAQLINFGLILSTAFMMWKGLSVIADSPSPIVVVLSGSMEPAFQRGDLLFLWNRNVFEETKVGEIVVYNVKGKDIPIVHRVVRKFGTG